MNPSIENIQEKLFDKLINTGWDQKLRRFVKSPDMYDIVLSLVDEKNLGGRFTPAFNDIFRPFELCPLHKLKVIVLYPEPYPNPLMNNGLAISHTGTLIDHVPFKAFYEELLKAGARNSLMNGDLSSWARQGILLLNTSLTTRVNQPGKHYRIWQPFVSYWLDGLVRDDEKRIFVQIGENPYWSDIDDRHVKLSFPPLPTERKVKWDTGFFHKVNQAIVENNMAPIIW